MNSGKLKHRINLQAFTTTVDPETGYRTKEWAETAQLWASIEPLSGRDFIAAGARQSELSVRIVVRFTESIGSGMRLAHRGKIYDIKAVLPDPDTGREYLTLMCGEGVNDG